MTLDELADVIAYYHTLEGVCPCMAKRIGPLEDEYNRRKNG
jgi:hypothetical protein